MSIGLACRLSELLDVFVPWNSLLLPSMSDYFCNLGDGVLKGGEEDPRVAVIEIIPVSVKYWISKQSGISRAIQVSASAAMGKATASGELQTIDKEEVSETYGDFFFWY